MNVIITGASRGMGRAIAERFAAGHHNLLLCARNEVQLYNTMNELLTRFPNIMVKCTPADLSTAAGAKQFGEWVKEQVVKLPAGKPDVLVNNAGEFLPGSIHDEEEGTLEKMVHTNLYSAYHVTRSVLPVMMQHRQGHIFNMCSVASIKAYANGGAYSVSKFALLGLSRNLREEMKPFGIKVTAVIPGAVYTDSWSESGIPPERMMECNDIAELIFAAAMLSPQAVVEDIVVRPQLGDL